MPEQGADTHWGDDGREIDSILDVYKRQHVGWFVPFNILLNAAVSWSIYFVGRRLSRAKGIGFLCGLMFLISRMAYYQIGQVLGLMETMALWMAVMILWYLFRYLNEKDSQIYFCLSCVLYFGVCFVHERYMALFPLLLLVLLFKKSRKLSLIHIWHFHLGQC